MKAIAQHDGEDPSSPGNLLRPIDKDLDWDRLVLGVKNAGIVADDLRRDYPSLKPYLVITAGGEFVRADSSMLDMFKESPGIFFQNTSATEYMKHIKLKPPANLLGIDMKSELDSWMKQWGKELQRLSAGLRFLPCVLFEIRFGHLEYKEIWRMQKDERIDSTRTPQTKASIRIVLGSVEEFAADGVAGKVCPGGQ